MWSDHSQISRADPTRKAWPCYFNENNKTLSTSGDEDDKPAKIFLTSSKLILMISVFLDSPGLHDSPHPLSEDWSLHWWSIQLDDGNIFMLFSWILFNQNYSQLEILTTASEAGWPHWLCRDCPCQPSHVYFLSLSLLGRCHRIRLYE